MRSRSRTSTAALAVGLTAAAIVATGCTRDRPAAALDFGAAVAVAPDGTVYVLDRQDGQVLEVRGNAVRLAFAVDLPGGLSTMAVDAAGRVLVSNGSGDHPTIVRIAADGTRTAVADDLPGVGDLAITNDGIVLVLTGTAGRVIRIAPDGTRNHLAGPHSASDPPVPAGHESRFPEGVDEIGTDTDGTLLVLSAFRLWRVPVGGEPELLAGSLDPPSETGTGDAGPAVHALLEDPTAPVATPAGYFLCDGANRHLRRIDRQGRIDTILSFQLREQCADLAAVPGTSDLVALDQTGRLRRISPDGRQTLLLGHA
jgi:hypothetical protein